MSNTTVLVLNQDWSLDDIVSWQKAVCLLLSDKVYMAVEYAGQFIRSTSMTLPFPAVLVRKKFVRQKKVRLNRKHILARDAYQCQYCGARPTRPGGGPDLSVLTVDHVVPRAQAIRGQVQLPWGSGQRSVRVTSWENCLTACSACNSFKANRTPKEAKMQMRRIPAVPTPQDLARMKLFAYDVPEEWEGYLPV